MFKETSQRLTYTERLRKLDIPSLEFRREMEDMVETYKIMQGIYDEETTKTLVVKSSNSITRNNNNKLFKSRCNTKMFQHFFTNRIINKWNSLPREIVCAESLNLFKNKLDKHRGYLKYSTNIE